jgi:hypothetical protein
LIVVGAVVLAGATSTIVALSMLGGDPPTSTAPAVSPPPPAHSKVKFELEPPGAAIEIDGKLAHTGAPWSTELPAGNYQVEIRHPGHKAWRTTLELSPGESASMRAVLEPMVAPSEDATLAVATTPSGLDVYIDGTLFPQPSPIKTMLKVGSHTISVRQSNIEVWRTTIDAEAASDYEFNPSFTDAKKRERAQRSKPKPVPQSSPPDTVLVAPDTSMQPTAPVPESLPSGDEGHGLQPQ